jgi:hypothetical protein
MPGAFSRVNGKGLPRALALLKAALAGGLVRDDEQRDSGASAIVLSLTEYESKIRSSGAGTQQIVQLPVAGARTGQRKLITFDVEGVAGDSIRINAGAGGALISEAIAIVGVTGLTEATSTNVDLAAAGDFALFEFVSRATPSWNLVYARGATLS